jgi:hypothetical protein
MTAKLSFFPVGNGDMTLVETASGRKILIDCNIREGSDYPGVLTQLRDKLSRDSKDRLYIDLFIWTHPDEDHCRGIDANFHLAPPDDWSNRTDKIFIREIWASPLVYKRASTNHVLCDDAKALNREVKRRVVFFKEMPHSVSAGEYVKLLTESEDDKTDDVSGIVISLDEETQLINDSRDNTFKCRILGPAPKADLDEDEEKLGKNHSSVIANIELASSDGFLANKARFLFGGDAEVVCWEHLWQRLYSSFSILDHTDWLSYDILLAPHHCSWRSLSHDSWSDCKKADKKAEVSDDAHSALSQAKDDAFIIASTNAILDDDNDPPCIGAKREYRKIVNDVDGQFKCVDDHKHKGENVPLEIHIDEDDKKIIPTATIFTSESAEKSVNRQGGDGYA